MDVQKVYFNEESGKPEQLLNRLERLYVQGGRYELHFQASDLELIEKAFDQIISKYGIRAVDFVYSLTEARHY